MPVKEKTDEQYLALLHDKSISDAHGCKLWQGSKVPAGYGKMWFKGRIVGAHRVSFLLQKGEIPEGMYVCHSCDTPSCIAPKHLFAASPKDNQRDMDSKRRGRFLSKLTASQVEELRLKRAAGDSLKTLSGKFNVSEATASLASRSKTWISARKSKLDRP